MYEDYVRHRGSVDMISYYKHYVDKLLIEIDLVDVLTLTNLILSVQIKFISVM